MDTVGNEICVNNPTDADMDNDQFIENTCEEKENNDFLFAGWPEIVTLEDADRMFRSFDSPFGCGEFGNEDEFSWLSSQCNNGSDAVMKSEIKFPFSESSSLRHIMEEDGPSKAVESNGAGPFNFSSGLSNDENMINNQNRSERPRLFGNLQIGTPFSISGMEFESNGVTTPSSQVEDFSDISHGTAQIDGFFDHSFGALAKNIDGNSKKIHYGYLNNSECIDATSYDPTSVSKRATKRNLENLDYTNVSGTSCLSFELDVTSLEASRLYQLQQVMYQLDIRTKLCLRDGLYRLARSAKRRHSSISANGRAIDDGDVNGIEGTKERNGIMDIETDTNSIDRSVAHLLFHRPIDSSANSNCDGSSLNSHTMVNFTNYYIRYK